MYRPLELQLWYGNSLVADLHRAFPHQGTWFGEYDLRIAPGQSDVHDKLLGYIAFCEDFHRRIAEGQAYDYDEFAEFASIASCDSWTARMTSGVTVPMEGEMLFADGQASWQHPETAPSTEAAANEFWARASESRND